MRKVGAVALAIPVLVAAYVAAFARERLVGRIASALGAGAVIGLVIVASLPPASSNAAPRSEAPPPVAAQLLDAVRTGHGLTAPFTIRFDAPMDAASVAAAVRIAPDAAFTLDWDAAGSTLTVAPVGHWAPDTLYTVTVTAGARASSGGTLAAPVRAVALTERAGSGALTATRSYRGETRVDSAFRIAVDRPVSLAAVRAALRAEPGIDGLVTAGPEAGTFVFTPSDPLAPGTRYRIWLQGLSDDDGVPFDAAPAMSVRTAAAPAVVRFRPRDDTQKVERSVPISVRFTERMARASTQAAFHVEADGKALAGSFSWAEKDTVLVFVPASPLPYGAKVDMRVDAGALSRAGVPMPEAGAGRFTVEPKPKARPAKQPRTSRIPRSGGGGAVSGSWRGVEAYYLRLMNCTRTGGWVTTDGSCSSPGGRNVAPLSLSSGISSQVSRPYAKLLATRGLCDHFIGGNPGDRLRRAGYTSYRWAENLGCRSGNPYSAVLGSHRYFQSEKSYNGGHWRNLMNADYDRAGIGVWVSGGRVRLVIDFYHP